MDAMTQLEVQSYHRRAPNGNGLSRVEFAAHREDRRSETNAETNKVAGELAD